MAMTVAQCYNKGCGCKYDPATNVPDACQYHPGLPVFHDARKIWSCCNKSSTDFTEFLSIKGCTRGPHSNEQPKEPEKQNVLAPKYDQEVVSVNVKPTTTIERPSADEILTPLNVMVSPSLQPVLDSKKAELAKLTQMTSECALDSEVPVGETCKNSGCSVTYAGPDTNKEMCIHHPGVAIFHEGLKFWTCCQRKTTDWDAFVAQTGCTTGRHTWTKKTVGAAGQLGSTCRHDWHQTGAFVTLSVFAKAALPEQTLVSANRVALSVHIPFEAGQVAFEKNFLLHGVIDPSASSVKIMGSKVEINLKKAEPGAWPTLELKRLSVPPDQIKVDE